MSYKIIDVHAHIGVSASLQVAGGARDVMRIMDENGIDQSVVLPIPGYQDPDGIKDTMMQNDHIAQAVKEFPDRFPRGLGAVEPRHGERALPEVDRIMGELGLSGLVFHNDFCGLPIDHPMMYDILKKAAEHKDIIVMMHTAQHSMLENPFQLGKVVEAFPEITFIDAHPMMSETHLSATIELAKRYPNLYFDMCSAIYHFDAIEKAVADIGEDRLLFGSDNPYYDYCVEKDILAVSAVPEPAKKKIFYENARKLYRLQG